MRATARWRSRATRIGEQLSTWKVEWQVERDLEDALAGDAPIVAGPWLSEVGYEVLYWAPFLRWVAAAYRIPSSRFIVMSRGGTASWYRDIASRYVEVFDHVTPDEVAARSTDGVVKQRTVEAFDLELARRGCDALGIGAAFNVLHPSLMFRWLSPFWSGQESLGFVERHTRHVRLAPPDVPLPFELPREYVALKFYAARSLPDDPAVRRQLHAVGEALGRQCPIVQLDTGLALDDHADLEVFSGASVLSVRGRLDRRTNLAVQTRIIAGARMFMGTCGSVAWLAPLLGVPTVPVFTDASLLHAHLHVARRVYGRVGGGRFSPVDLSGLLDAGLTVADAAPGGAS